MNTPNKLKPTKLYSLSSESHGTHHAICFSFDLKDKPERVGRIASVFGPYCGPKQVADELRGLADAIEAGDLLEDSWPMEGVNERLVGISREEHLAAMEAIEEQAAETEAGRVDALSFEARDPKDMLRQLRGAGTQF